MTLNTFHFAGRGEMNVTLGIPRYGAQGGALPLRSLPHCARERRGTGSGAGERESKSSSVASGACVEPEWFLGIPLPSLHRVTRDPRDLTHKSTHGPFQHSATWLPRPAVSVILVALALYIHTTWCSVAIAGEAGNVGRTAGILRALSSLAD